jgi:hypothetical protein
MARRKSNRFLSNPLRAASHQEVSLEDIEDEDQMIRAMRNLDLNLEEEIVSSIRREVERAWDNAEYEDVRDVIDGVSDEVLIDALDDDVKSHLVGVPHQTIATAMRDEITKRGGVMSIDNEYRRGGSVIKPAYVEFLLSLDFPPLSWIPDQQVFEFLKLVASEADWENVYDKSWSSGWMESGEWLLVIDKGEIDEWAVDLRTKFLSDVIDGDPQAAIGVMFDMLEENHPAIYRKVTKAKFPKDVLADYALAYLEDPDDSGLEILSQAVGEFGYEGSRGEVLLEIDKEVLRSLGVKSDNWMHGAPWRLINLPSEELLYEGTLMRHCVGRRDMGYREAVERGDMQIWSLRSQHNKPVATFEVDMQRWEDAPLELGEGGPEERGRAIAQLKGKLNRRMGTQEGEEEVFSWIFSELYVNPRFVSDYAGSDKRSANPSGFNSPWTPYRTRRTGSKNSVKRRVLR